MMSKRVLICLSVSIAVLMSILILPVEARRRREPPPPPKPVSREIKALQDDFLKLKFGMFIHYNMATYEKKGWTDGYPDPSRFKPGVETIDTDAWADAAKAAGMTYGVLTAKHVSSFCLWDSKYTTYDVMHPDCPYKKDIVAQFIKSFKSRGLKAGLYYCWRHPGFGKPETYKVLPPECDPSKHSVAEQIEFQKKQIAELLEKYPDVFYIWHDGLDPSISGNPESILGPLRKIRPDVIHSANWWNAAKKGHQYADIAVTEKFHFFDGNKLPGETCWLLDCPQWFYTGPARTGSAQEMVGHLRKANSLNANFLLNVGPDQDGKIFPESVKALAEMGKLQKQDESADESEQTEKAGKQ